jgi:hypothetical protein
MLASFRTLTFGTATRKAESRALRVGHTTPIEIPCYSFLLENELDPRATERGQKDCQLKISKEPNKRNFYSLVLCTSSVLLSLS